MRAAIVALVAGAGVTVLEIDFKNPPWADDHCPPRATFVHRLTDKRSHRLDISYVSPESALPERTFEPNCAHDPRATTHEDVAFGPGGVNRETLAFESRTAQHARWRADMGRR